MDLDSTLQEYQIQLEQVEFALKSDKENDELLKLKIDLEEVIKLTQDLITETSDKDKEKESSQPAKSQKKYEFVAYAGATTDKMIIPKQIRWKTGEKCMAVWKDGKYYPAVIDQLVEDDGTCTVIFDGYKTSELVQISQIMPRNKNTSQDSHDASKKPLTKKELEQKLREAKKRKREKYEEKVKTLEELSEKDKNKWKSFNNKLASKTWKGVVKKNKFELPSHHENKIGVGANVNTKQQTSGLAEDDSETSSKSLQQQQYKPARYKSESYKQSMF